jgi:hypothetical protein
MLANFLAWMHEQFLKTLRAAVLRGQEHALLNDWSAGDWCFGYTSEPIPGSEAGRRGRDAKHLRFERNKFYLCFFNGAIDDDQ